MSSDLLGMTWLQRAAHYDRLAEHYRQEGNQRDEEFARVNAGTCRLMAIEDEEVKVSG